MLRVNLTIVCMGVMSILAQQAISQKATSKPSPELAAWQRELGSYEFTVRSGGKDGEVTVVGTTDVQMILEGQFLVNRSLWGRPRDESLTIMGLTGNKDAEYFQISIDGNQTGFAYTVGGMEDDGSRLMSPLPEEAYKIRTTFGDDGGFTTSFFVGAQQMPLFTTIHTRVPRQSIDVLDTMLALPVKPARVNRRPGFSKEHLLLHKFAGDFQSHDEEYKLRSRIICQGRYLISKLSAADHDVVCLTGFDSTKKLFWQIVLDPNQSGFQLFEGEQQTNGKLVLHSDRGAFSRTLAQNADGAFTFSEENRTMRFHRTGDGRSREVAGGKTDEPRPGKLKWGRPLGGVVDFTSPAIAEDGTIYIGGGDRRLYAINPDGTEKWSFAASGHVVAAPTIGKDGTIYIGTNGKRIHAIAPDGMEKWSYPLGGKARGSSPALGEDGTIYIGCDDFHLYAISPDGTLKWRFRTEGRVFSSPAVGHDGTIYIASVDGNLYAVHREDGSKKWSFQTGAYLHGSPSIAEDGTVYIGSSDKNLYAINPQDGSERWRFSTEAEVHAPPAIGMDHTLYVGSNDGHMYALNPDGTEKWRFLTGLRVDSCSAAIGKDGTIYFGSDDNHIYALNKDGTEKWRFEMNGIDDMDSSPAIGDDGTIYVASRDGNLYAIYGESGGLAETPWPMFGRDLRHTGR